MSISFLLTTLVVVATPGTGVVRIVPHMPATITAYGVLAASVRSHVTSRPRVMAWLRRGFAGSFVALGAKLALTAR
jgi:threonine/homoserine/homoserine lactone efflux protein